MERNLRTKNAHVQERGAMLGLIGLLLFASASRECPQSDWSLVESIPIGINLSSPQATHTAFISLFNNAQRTIDIAAMYVTLRGCREFNRTWGEDVFQSLASAIRRGVAVRLAVANFSEESDAEVTELEKIGAVIRYLDVAKILGGDGILHTKFIVVDSASYYIGSANMDWRALSDVKEMGIYVKNCQAVALDLEAIFGVYWLLAGEGVIPSPDRFPVNLLPRATQDSPFDISLSGESFNVWLGGSPVSLNAPLRTWDLDSFLHLILSAKPGTSVYAEVMDYAPVTMFAKQKKFWPLLDNALREAALINQVKIHFLASKWAHTNPTEINFLRSLDAYENIEVRFIYFNDTKPVIPYSRVNHAKYAVSDTLSFISTSNWQADYFLSTMGVGHFCTSGKVITDLKTKFLRDWNSPYAHSLTLWERYI